MKSIALVFLSLAAASLIACGQARVGAIDEAEGASPVVGEPNPDDPYGYCFFVPPEQWDPNTPMTRLQNIDASTGLYGCTGHSMYSSSQETCYTHAMPTHPCNSDAECPGTISGTAQVVCINHACVLPCNDGETCPDGLACDDGWIQDGKTGAPLPTARLCMSVIAHECVPPYEE